MALVDDRQLVLRKFRNSRVTRVLTHRVIGQVLDCKIRVSDRLAASVMYAYLEFLIVESC